MALTQHPDVRALQFGVQGLSLWNILLIFVFIGCMFNREHERLTWDMPRHINVLLLLYFIVVVIGFFRMLLDTDELINYAILSGDLNIPTNISLFSEYFINTIKFAIPGLLLFYGCNSRSRLMWGIISLLAVYFLLGVQVIKWMPLSSITGGEELSYRSNKILQNEIGYGRVNLSTMLAGASWAIFSTIVLLKNKRDIVLVSLAGLMVIFAQALTGGRGGYVAWLGVGLILCFIRWRKIIIFLPAIAIIVLLTVPGFMERISAGFSASIDTKAYTSTDKGDVDKYTLTSGRNIAWPYELKAIRQAPWIGYGRMAMQRTGLSTYLLQEYDELFPHPHQAYLQWLMDNGILGFIPVIIFYIVILKYSISLFRDNRSPVFISIGGITLSIVSALLIASFSSQTFYPREGAVAMWCAIGLMFRVFIERSPC